MRVQVSSDCEIAKLLMLTPIVLLEPEYAKKIVECVDKLGVPRESPMFKHALSAIFLVNPTKINAKLDFLKKVLRCCMAELYIAVFKLSYIVSLTEANLSPNVKFLKMEVALEPNYIVHRPAVLCYNLKKRLMPGHFVLKALKAKGLLKTDVDFYAAVSKIEKTFVKRFLDLTRRPFYAAARDAGSSVPPGIQL